MGAVFIIVSLYIVADSFNFMAHSTKTTGMVVSVYSHRSAQFPIVAFTDNSGIVHTQKTAFGSSTFAYKPGDQIAIRYNTGAARTRVEVDGFQAMWDSPIFFTGMGVIFIVIHFLRLNRANPGRRIGDEANHSV